MVAQDSLDSSTAFKNGETPTSADIERDIEKTREALSVKISRLEEEVEDKVRHTVDQVSGQIMDTVDEITGKVKNSITSVQNAMDLRVHMERDPLRTIGGVVIAGFAFGAWLALRARPQRMQTSARSSSRMSGTMPIIRGILGTVAMTAAQRMVQQKVDAYLQPQESPRHP